MSIICISEAVFLLAISIVTFVQLCRGNRNLEEKLPLLKIEVYIGVIVLTLLDLVAKSMQSESSLAFAVVLAAEFEILSNYYSMKDQTKAPD